MPVCVYIYIYIYTQAYALSFVRMLCRVALNNRWCVQQVLSVWWMTHFLMWKSRSAKFLLLFVSKSKRRVVVRAIEALLLMDGICEILEKDWKRSWERQGSKMWQEANYHWGHEQDLRHIVVRHSWNSRNGWRLQCCTFHAQFHVLLTVVLPSMSSCFISVLYIMETHEVTAFWTCKLCSVGDTCRCFGGTLRVEAAGVAQLV